MARYSFVTVWRFRSPPGPVWDMISRVEEWPAWWRGVERVELVRAGDADGVGAVHRHTWKSRLPYRLSFEVRTTRVVPHALIEGEAAGELTGRGLWRFLHEAGVTTARYDWDVVTTKLWMNLLAPVARPVFRVNHDAVMSWGAEGLARRLGLGDGRLGTVA